MLRVFLIFVHDITAAAVAWMLAYWLRFNMEISPAYVEFMLQTMFWVVPIQALVFWSFGLYRGIWRYASLQDLQRLLRAVGVAALVSPLVLFVVQLAGPLPRTVLVLDPILLLLIMCGSRFAYRTWKEHALYGRLRYQGEPVFVLGAGETGVTLQRELERSPAWRVVGFLDDDVRKKGLQLQGVKVLGRIPDLAHLASVTGVKHAVMAMPGASRAARRAAVDLCAAANVKVLTVPSYDDLVSGRVTVSSLRNVELDDLLGREPVVLDDAGLHALITGHTVMVTGAGGSIGSELCRQIARFEPRLLILFEASEFALYAMGEELTQKLPALNHRCVIGDVKDAARVKDVISSERPDVIFHAAAYKHVPLMENENAWSALQNNVLGTYVVASTAAEHGVGKFVLISTDKAVNPVNVMGATKRLAEKVCQALQARTSMQLVAVRFGNVLGSTGSVIPKFREQLARGGPITVTHPDIIRYFMSIPEAAQLVLQAGLMGKNGEVFILDMGDPVRIVDLARDMIRLSGMSEDDIAIRFTGLRPGEKLFEELMTGDETSAPTTHPKLRVARTDRVEPELIDELMPWLAEARPMPESTTKAVLRRWVDEYRADGEAPPPASTSGAGATAQMPLRVGYHRS